MERNNGNNREGPGKESCRWSRSPVTQGFIQAHSECGCFTGSAAPLRSVAAWRGACAHLKEAGATYTALVSVNSDSRLLGALPQTTNWTCRRLLLPRSREHTAQQQSNSAPKCAKKRSGWNASRGWNASSGCGISGASSARAQGMR